MNDIKINQSISNLKRALSRLEEALSIPKDNPVIVDATIQRFKFVIELYWKTLKRLLAQGGIQTDTLRDTLKKAYAAGWIKNETPWLQMLRDRNETSYVYDEKKAEEIYQHIRDNFAELQSTFEFLTKRSKQ